MQRVRHWQVVDEPGFPAQQRAVLDPPQAPAHQLRMSHHCSGGSPTALKAFAERRTLEFRTPANWRTQTGGLTGEVSMSDQDSGPQGFDRRNFLKGAVVGGAAAATGTVAATTVADAQAQPQ